MTALDEAAAAFTGDAPAPGVIASEKAILGSMVGSRQVTEAAHDALRSSEALWDPFHQLVFEAAVSLAGDGVNVDPAAVLGRIPSVEPGRPISSHDGVALAELIEHKAPIGWHCQVVQRDWERRRLRQSAMRILQQTLPGADNAQDVAETARGEIDALLGAVADSGIVSVGELLGPVLDDLESPLADERSIPTGLADVDAMLSGLRAGQLAVIGARPGFGKSVLALALARHAAIRMGAPVLLVSMEMLRDEIMHRLIAAEAGVNLETIQRRLLDDRDWQRISRIHEAVSAAPLFIDDAQECTLARLRLRLTRMARTDPARLVIIDYLQLMRTAKAENRQIAVADLVRGLKNLAGEFAVPVVACAQVGRDAEKRHDRRPMLSDLRESGEIESAADVVLLLNRADFYDPADRPGETDVIVAKQRQGRLGDVAVGFQGEYGRFVDLARTGRPWSPGDSLEGR